MADHVPQVPLSVGDSGCRRSTVGEWSGERTENKQLQNFTQGGESSSNMSDWRQEKAVPNDLQEFLEVEVKTTQLCK